MPEAPPKLVVRTYAPARGRVLTAAVILSIGFAFYLTYEYGRFDAGYDRLAVGQRETELEVTIERLEKASREQRVKLAELETTRMGQARERAEVSRTIGELQAQVGKQAQELAFYRGIVSQGGNPADVKIQRLRVDAAEGVRRYRIRLTLVQPVRPENMVSGTATLKLEGVRASEPATLTLDALTGTAARDVPFTFRYFENIDSDVTLPEGFRPERVVVEVRSARKGVAPVTQTFLWDVEA